MPHKDTATGFAYHRQYRAVNKTRLLAQQDERRARNVAFVAEVNARTFCAHCGAQPIEWHNPDHVALGLQLHRIGEMARRAYAIETIRAEMARCTPLCRRCHMAEDGRLQQFVTAGGSRMPKGSSLPPKPCTECARLSKPLRRGLCGACYARGRRAS